MMEDPLHHSGTNIFTFCVCVFFFGSSSAKQYLVSRHGRSSVRILSATGPRLGESRSDSWGKSISITLLFST